MAINKESKLYGTAWATGLGVYSAIETIDFTILDPCENPSIDRILSLVDFGRELF